MSVLVLYRSGDCPDTPRVGTVIPRFIIRDKVDNIQAFLFSQLLHTFDMALWHDQQVIDNIVALPDIVEC